MVHGFRVAKGASRKLNPYARVAMVDYSEELSATVVDDVHPKDRCQVAG